MHQDSITKPNTHRFLRNYFSFTVIWVLIMIFGMLWWARTSQNHVSMQAVVKDPVQAQEAEQVFHEGEYVPQVIPPMPRGEERHYVSGDKLVPVLMYHHIRTYTGKDKIEAGLSVTPEAFAAQLDWLKSNGYHTITLTDLFAGRVVEKSVVLTFDDGYADNYAEVFPRLRERGQKGVFFIISGYVGAGSYMNSAQLREMSDAGMDVQSHTVTHIDMQFANKGDMDNQLTKSKADLEAITGKPVGFLCYPSGRFGELTEREAKAAGYKAAVTTQPFAKSGNNYEIPRIRMFPTTTAQSLQGSFDAYLGAANGYKWNFSR